jgi:hypothetical protein
MTRTDAQVYFSKFGILIDTDGKRLNCFKCGLDLKYTVVSTVKPTTVNYYYLCTRNHKFTYNDIVLKHAELMNSLVQNLSDGNVCNT